MLYHASPVPELRTLLPHRSNHNRPLVYLSAKKENTFVYLSNAIEKYCSQAGITCLGNYKKWASYGFTQEGLLRLEEYYPNAISDTYQGVSGYIYAAAEAESCCPQPDIPFAFFSEKPVEVSCCEYISDAYEAITEAAADGKIVLRKYKDQNQDKLGWIQRTIESEYRISGSHPEYRAFLKAKFPFLSK